MGQGQVWRRRLFKWVLKKLQNNTFHTETHLKFLTFPKASHLDQNVNRKVQGVPQSQTAANPRHQEEEKNDKN